MSAGFNALGVISPEGKCHSFDADANGYLRSEGAFVFAIKPLAAAERDGDPIHAVVEATAVNAAGAADGSAGLAQGRYITAPTRHAQVELMRTASARAGRTPQEFDYVEAHATGTVVGDRIEGNAIGEALGGGEREAPLRVAGVKSNVGHMEAAAFCCALLKVVLMMQRRTFAPVSKNHLVPNPEIDFEGHRMRVQTECEPFPDHPVVVGINSFGFGGSNGHCVVRERRRGGGRAALHRRLQRPLKGVFHLAGTLDDCLLADLTPESLATVFAPKARGALNLHHATAGCDLDHFVLFSSIASTLGNPGQINYSAANGFVDGLAALRRRQGLPALCYNLAAVAEAGMAARNLHVLRMSRAGGVPPVSADFAITNLDYAMRAMGGRDHLITALFSRPPWTVDSPDYLRTGRMLSNPGRGGGADRRQGGRAVRPRRGQPGGVAVQLRPHLHLGRRAGRVHPHAVQPSGQRPGADDHRHLPVPGRSDHAGRPERRRG